MIDRFELIENACESNADSPPVECTDVLRPEDCALALAEIQTCSGHQSTPLRSLPGMARAAGIGELLYKAARPRFIIVEPEIAACLLASAAAGKRVHIDSDLDTMMAGLACGEPSLIAWPLLAAGSHYFMCLDDGSAFAAMRRLAAGEGGDTPVVGGESGVAGLAGLLALCGDPDSARRLALDEHARVLVFGTEGDTDAALYTEIVGESGDQVRARQ
jgi:threonine dehydratase